MRELIQAKIKAIGKPKPDPFDKSDSPRMQVGVLLEVDGLEEWVNVYPDSPWLKEIRRGQVVPVVKEWSKKKKDRETGKEGAYAYRPILIKTDLPAGKPASAPQSSSIDAKLAGRLVDFFRWLAKAPEGETIAPMTALLRQAKAGGLLDAATFKEYGHLFVEAGKLFAALAGSERKKAAARPAKDTKPARAPDNVDWNEEVRRIEARLQLAYEQGAQALDEVMRALNPADYPAAVGRRVQYLKNCYSPNPA